MLYVEEDNSVKCSVIYVKCYHSIHQARYYICLDHEWGKTGHINITTVISHGAMLDALEITVIMIYCIYSNNAHMSSLI